VDVGRTLARGYDRRVPSSTVCLSFDFDAMSVWFGYDRTTHVEGGVLTVCMHRR
jgi:hypothetical protein